MAEEGGAVQTEWTEGLTESQMAIVQNKGWDSPVKAVQAYENAQKLIGADPSSVVKLPTSPEDESWNDVYTKLGRPETPDAYSFKMEQAGTEFEQFMKNAVHKAGLNNQQAQQLASQLSEYSQNNVERQQADVQEKLATEKNELTKEWGAAHEQNMLQAKVAAKNLNFTEQEISGIESAIGYKATMKMFQRLGEKVGEANYKDGEGEGGFKSAMTPEQAKAEHAALMSDPNFVKAWSDKYAPGHKEAVEKKARLAELAYGS